MSSQKENITINEHGEVVIQNLDKLAAAQELSLQELNAVVGGRGRSINNVEVHRANGEEKVALHQSE